MRNCLPELPSEVRSRLDCHPEIPDVVPLNQLGVKHVAGLRTPPEHQLNRNKVRQDLEENMEGMEGRTGRV